MKLFEERRIRGEDRDYLLTYELVHQWNTPGYVEDYYDILVKQYIITEKDLAINAILERDRELVDHRKIHGLTESLIEAEDFLSMAADGTVMPVSLFEIYDDWMCAFHPRWED